MKLSTMSIRELIIELADTEATTPAAGHHPDRLAYQQALIIELRRRQAERRHAVGLGETAGMSLSE